ncbi:MAG: APC family permease [Oscillospiraceae bacterium]|nr:APC family permease [Oscillospiraceae bacterium]
MGFKKLRRILIGEPLDNEALKEEKYSLKWGLPILSSDAISSVAYAGQEILMILIPAIGVLAYRQLTILSGVIIFLLFLLMLSYRQTIDCYPNGGGAYTVAKENIGTVAGVVAGAALSVDYILTVAVSVSSGVEQITSAFLTLRPYKVPICILLVLLLMLGNLRGVRESSKIFGLPAYAFILGILFMIVMGFFKLGTGYVPPEPTLPAVVQPLTMMLMLRAFSNGCSALTGVEAVSNAVPNFKEPSQRNAKTILLLLAVIIFVLFGGTAALAYFYHVVPGEKAMLILIASEIFGQGFMFYYVTITTFIILIMAANTAYSGFPMLVSVMAKEGFMPRQLSMRGNRLSFDYGILLLSAAAMVLIVIFKAQVGSLIGLYAIGVFISFTLSQSGMFLRWVRRREGHWVHKALINGIGALATVIVVGIIAVTKFNQGAWIVVFLIPLIVLALLKIKRHYTTVRDQLRLEREECATALQKENRYRNRVIVPLESVNRASVRALRYAQTISDNVTVFSVVINKAAEEKNRERYSWLKTDIPIIIKYSPYREIVGPLLEFIRSAEYNCSENDIITVILPQFRVNKLWQRILHNNTRVYIERELLKQKNIVISTMPLQIEAER